MSRLAQYLRDQGFNAIATSEIKRGYSIDNPPKNKKSKKKQKKSSRRSRKK